MDNDSFLLCRYSLYLIHDLHPITPTRPTADWRQDSAQGNLLASRLDIDRRRLRTVAMRCDHPFNLGIAKTHTPLLPERIPPYSPALMSTGHNIEGGLTSTCERPSADAPDAPSHTLPTLHQRTLLQSPASLIILRHLAPSAKRS